MKYPIRSRKFQQTWVFNPSQTFCNMLTSINPAGPTLPWSRSSQPSSPRDDGCRLGYPEQKEQERSDKKTDESCVFGLVHVHVIDGPTRPNINITTCKQRYKQQQITYYYGQTHSPSCQSCLAKSPSSSEQTASSFWRPLGWVPSRRCGRTANPRTRGWRLSGHSWSSPSNHLRSNPIQHYAGWHTMAVWKSQSWSLKSPQDPATNRPKSQSFRVVSPSKWPDDWKRTLLILPLVGLNPSSGFSAVIREAQQWEVIGG